MHLTFENTILFFYKEQKKTGGGGYTPQLTERGARILASVPPLRPPISNAFDDYFTDAGLL